VEEQAGFRAGRSCNDNTFVLKQLIEKQLSVRNEVHLLFIDLKAYDDFPWIKLESARGDKNKLHFDQNCKRAI
jgi:hypothetical protein